MGKKGLLRERRDECEKRGLLATALLRERTNLGGGKGRNTVGKGLLGDETDNCGKGGLMRERRVNCGRERVKAGEDRFPR